MFTTKQLINSTRQVGLVTVALTLALAANFAYGQWANPTAQAPNNNASAPVNVGGVAQEKAGNLSTIGVLGGTTLVAGGAVWSDLYCDGLGENCSSNAGGGGSATDAAWIDGPTIGSHSLFEMVCPAGEVLIGLRLDSQGGCLGSCSQSAGPLEEIDIMCAPIGAAVGAVPGSDSYTYSWVVTSGWGACASTGSQSRSVSCVNDDSGIAGAASNCDSGTRPVSSQSCSYTPPRDPSDMRCFIAGTQVTMVDGSLRDIEAVQIGEFVLGQDDAHNEVLAFERPMLGGRELFSINNSAHFVTPAHPFLTTDGWKSIKMSAIHQENTVLVDELSITELAIGDEMIKADGTTEVVVSIEGSAAEDQQLYNFYLGGDGTYFVDGFLTHDEFNAGETVQDADPSMEHQSNSCPYAN
jgi:hypothetical protein